jgi:SAM-dependent methyltransferase
MHTERRRAESFGAVATGYDDARPGYPSALIDDLLTPRPRTVLDVGSGTGKAAALLRARGVQVLAVEIDARMAAVARAHGLEVEVAAFESWADAGRRFELITVAQAWHWVDPVAGGARALALLRPGGRLALFWNFASFAPALQQAMDEVYDVVAPELSRHSVIRGGGPQTLPSHIRDLRAAGFGAVEHRRYPWTLGYPIGRWLALIRTHSDHAGLGAARLDELCECLGAAIDEHGGVVRAQYVSELLLAHRPAP